MNLFYTSLYQLVATPFCFLHEHVRRILPQCHPRTLQWLSETCASPNVPAEVKKLPLTHLTPSNDLFPVPREVYESVDPVYHPILDGFVPMVQATSKAWAKGAQKAERKHRLGTQTEKMEKIEEPSLGVGSVWKNIETAAA